MTDNTYWISAPSFAIIMVIILVKEFRWLRIPNPLGRSLYLMIFFALIQSLPISFIDLSISHIIDGESHFFAMELLSFVSNAFLFVFWLNFVLRYAKMRLPISSIVVTIAALLAIAGTILVTANFSSTAQMAHPAVSEPVEKWRLAEMLYKDLLYVLVTLHAFKRIFHQLRQKKKIGQEYIASIIAALVPFIVNLLSFGNTPMCSLTLPTSCLILYIYAVSKERNALQHSKEMFLENMSHEIRTTLNSVYGFAQLLCLPEGTWSEEERQSYASHIHNSYNMLDMLLNDLMVSTRYDTHSYNVRMQPTIVRTVIIDAIDAIKVCVPSSVEVSLQSDLPDDFTIKSDGRRIRQIVQNLLTNASQYIVEGKIRVHLRLKGRTMKISVIADTPSKSDENRQNMMVQSIAKHKTGISLRMGICKKTAELIGGSVWRDISYVNGVKYQFKLQVNQVKAPAEESLQTPTSFMQAPAHA